MDKNSILKNAHPLIISSIRKYAMNKGEFEDLYQEGAITILEALNKYEEVKGVDIFYYLKLQLKFFYLNYGRYDKKAISLNEAIGDGIELMDTLADECSSVEDIFFSIQDSKMAYEAVRELQIRDRYIIEQSVVRMRTLDDLAQELNMSRTTLFRRKKEILNKLCYKLKSV